MNRSELIEISYCVLELSNSVDASVDAIVDALEGICWDEEDSGRVKEKAKEMYLNDF